MVAGEPFLERTTLESKLFNTGRRYNTSWHKSTSSLAYKNPSCFPQTSKRSHRGLPCDDPRVKCYNHDPSCRPSPSTPCLSSSSWHEDSASDNFASICWPVPFLRGLIAPASSRKTSFLHWKTLMDNYYYYSVSILVITYSLSKALRFTVNGR